MHIPDNYLSPSTCLFFAVTSGIILKVAAKKIKEELGLKQLSTLAIYSAFSFIIMMFNIPLPGGTSGHAVGAALTSIALGPWAAVISTSIALIIQAIFFGDGGILALGANIFNMGIIMPFSAFYIYRFLKKVIKNNKIVAFVAAYISLNISAFFTAFEFGIQPILFKTAEGLPMYSPYPLSISIPAMLIPHLLVAGIVEGVFTSGVLVFIQRTSPEMLNIRKMKTNPLSVILGILAILTPIGLIAQGTAWGEWGANEISEMVGYIPLGMEKGFNFNSLMPDYTISNISEIQAYLISALVGIAIIFVIFSLIRRFEKGKINE